VSGPPGGESLPVLGEIVAAQGLRGQVRVKLLVDAGRIGALRDVHVDGIGPLRVERTGWTRGLLVLTLTGVDDREAAEALRGRLVHGEMLDVPEGTITYGQLTGAVVRVDGVVWGLVHEVLPAGPRELLVIRGATGERLVPLQAEYVALGDDGVIEITAPPAGLLDDEAEEA
jgi:16S rRNA processing protein RimM